MSNVFPTRFTLPLTRQVRFTSRVNRAPDFTEFRAQDQPTPLYRWDLQLGPLSDTDATTIVSFYNSCGGPYQSFAFLDPLDNLLLWSEDVTQSAWQKTAPSELSVTSSVSDPFGGTGGQTVANTTSALNTVSQTVAANPAGITFTGSIWLRGSGAAITLRLTDGAAQTFTQSMTPAAAWTRHFLTGEFASGGTEIVFALDIPASSSATIFGAQLVATSGPGAYSRTTNDSGFHPNCSFDPTPVVQRVTGPGQNQLKLSVVEHA